MMQHVKTYWALVVGALLIAAGGVVAVATLDSDVPNDPNIGAGVLIFFGVIVASAGLAVVWSDRRTRRPGDDLTS